MTFPLEPRDPRIHVFSISDGSLRLAHRTYLSPVEEAPGTASVSDALGAPVGADHVEVFAVRDVAPMGLRSYLAQAHDVPPAAMEGDAGRLDALSGDVLVVAPRALDGLAALEPRPELTHIGSYAPAEADTTPRDLPPAAEPRPAAAPEETVAGKPLDRTRILWIVVAALVLAGLLFALL
ncbi:hypothetical protein [uncultured Jannaschia sp.]|uniref:hypothetical protein n=1 Tax=uncultured Jannaschia sp. TaxID=293347 RepID=UPI0026149392|nr:hypothetical protein [uncultured Jannaschia sp.]